MLTTQIFSLLTSPDNNQRKLAEEQYNALSQTNPDAFVQLHLEAMNTQDPTFRHTVATLFYSSSRPKEKENEKALFARLSPNARQALCPAIFLLAEKEPAMNVIKMLSEIASNVLVAMTAEALSVEPFWQEAVKFCQAPSEQHKVFGICIVSTLLLLLPDATQAVAAQQVFILLRQLLVVDSVEVILHAIDLYLNIAVLLDDETKNKDASDKELTDIMQLVIQACSKLMNSNNVQTIEKALETLSEFAIIPKRIFSPFVMTFVKGLMALANAQSLPFNLRIGAVSAILEMARPFKLLFKRQTDVMQAIFTLAFTW